MAVKGIGREYDATLIPGASLLTSTTQYAVVGMPPTSTVADKTVYLSGDSVSSVVDATGAAFFAIGVNQSLLSAGSTDCRVRLFGISKVVCAESITVGSPVMAYWGVSTTTMPGRIVNCDNGVSCSSATQSITSYCTILGRALEDGSTGTVISVFVNPQMYDISLVGTIGIT